MVFFAEWVDAFEELHADDPGFTLERSVVTDDSLLFLSDVPQKINNGRYEELGIEPVEAVFRRTVGNMVPVDEVGEMASHVDRLLAEREKFRAVIADTRSDYLFNFGKSSEIGADHILGVLETE